MDEALYDAILLHKTHGLFPNTFASTKSNFVSLCNQYEVGNGSLKRHGRWQATAGEIEDIFTMLHCHSGRDACYKRIKVR